MTKHNSPQRKTFFGLAALMSAILSDAFLGTSFWVSQMDITRATFDTLNQLTVSSYCFTGPIAFILSIIGCFGVHDSKKLSLIAMGLVIVPFLILFSQFVLSFVR